MIWLYGVLAWMLLVLWGLAILRLGSRGDRRAEEQEFAKVPVPSR